MKHSQTVVCALVMCVLLGSLEAVMQSGQGPNYAPLADLRRVFTERASSAPPDLPVISGPGAEGRWLAWASQHDRTIRQRLRGGDEDTLLNWLLLGRSFTDLPPVRLDSNATLLAVQAAIVLIRARTEALVQALVTPGAEERRLFALSTLTARGMNVTTPSDRAAVRDYLLRAVQAMLQGATPEATTTPTSQFERRGLSLDTAISPGFALEESLRTLSARRLMATGSVRRVAIVGAGLDFADKNTGFDFYPVQTLQPFAVLDTLRRLDLAPASEGVEIVALDISTRVLSHIAKARTVPSGYVLHLPLAHSEPWSAELRSYWSRLGDQIGMPTSSTTPPGVDMRAIRIPQTVVETVVPEDVNVIVARSRRGRFDLIVATNVLLYYGPFDQALALSNVEAMLNVGGVFLTDTALPSSEGSSLRKIGSHVTLYTTDRRGDEITWYQRLGEPPVAGASATGSTGDTARHAPSRPEL